MSRGGADARTVRVGSRSLAGGLGRTCAARLSRIGIPTIVALPRVGSRLNSLVQHKESDYSYVGRTPVTRFSRADCGRMDVLCCRERAFRCVRLGSRRQCRHATPSQIGPETPRTASLIRQPGFGTEPRHSRAPDPCSGRAECRPAVELPPGPVRGRPSSRIRSRGRRSGIRRCRCLAEVSDCRVCAATSARIST